MATAVAPPAAPPPTSATIRSLTAAGNHAAALRALSSLSASSSPLDHFALPPAIKSAAALRDARAACALHGAALRRALLHRPGPAVANALLTAYARCGDLDAALTLFAATPPELRDAVSYNSLISALCLFRRWEHALDALRAMLDEGRHAISSFTLVSVLLACSHLAADHRLGREAHAFALKNGFLDHRLGNERVANARRVFDMVPEPGRQLGMWNAMICGYAQAGMDQEALELFARMEGEAGCAPSETTMVGVLPACACSEAFTGKEAVHGYVVKRGMAGNQFFRNALMDMYARLGEMYGRLQPWAL